MFVIASPVGMIIGMNIDSEPNMALVVIQALSGGVFIYLACCDLLVHQFHSAPFISKQLQMAKFMSMTFGSCIVIFLIAIAPAHSH